MFLVLGFIALVTPLTPGAALLLAIGCELVGLRLVFLDRFLKRSRAREEDTSALGSNANAPALPS